MGNQIISSTKDSDGFYTITFRRLTADNNPTGDVLTKTKMYKYTVKNYIAPPLEVAKTSTKSTNSTDDPFISGFIGAFVQNFILNGSVFHMKAGDEVYFNVNDFTILNSQYNIEMIKRYIYMLENNYSADDIKVSDYLRTFTIPSDYTLPLEPNPDKKDSISNIANNLIQNPLGSLIPIIIGFVIFLFVVFIFVKLI